MKENILTGVKCGMFACLCIGAWLVASLEVTVERLEADVKRLKQADCMIVRKEHKPVTIYVYEPTTNTYKGLW